MAKENKTRYALLGILSKQSASGYEIKKIMEHSTNHFWREGDSSIYPILKELLDDGMVTCELANAESGKPKKIYTITSDGQQELEEWLVEDPSYFQSRNEMMLKVFFGWNVDKSVTIRHLENFRMKVAGMLEQYKLVAKKQTESILKGEKLHQYLTLKAGIIHTKASLSWCDEAIKLLKKSRK